jgi:hypothetical protein
MTIDNICVNCGGEIVIMCRRDNSRWCCQLCEKGFKENASQEDRDTGTGEFSKVIGTATTSTNSIDNAITDAGARKLIAARVQERTSFKAKATLEDYYGYR